MKQAKVINDSCSSTIATDLNKYRFYNGDFNDEQIEFLNNQRVIFMNLSNERGFDHDSYERDMWYTINRSGLFEDESWCPQETRTYISEPTHL